MSSTEWVRSLSDSLREHESERIEQRDSLARYEIVHEVRRGGMGVVYRAWDPQLGREVALKVLLQASASDPEARERFHREATLAARLHHPNIVPLYDSGEWMGQPCLAMQFIEGETLDKAGLDVGRALEAVRDAARGLDYAHRRASSTGISSRQT